jgi:hypothetical protein
VDKLQNQFLGLVWRGARIDHAGNEHDDYSAAVARLAGVLQGNAIDWEATRELNRLLPSRIISPTGDWGDPPNDNLHLVDRILDLSRSRFRLWDD